MSQHELDALDAEIVRVQQSTKTLSPAFARAHNWLRMKSRAYYGWHINPFHTAVHIFVLIAYLLNVSALSYQLLADVHPAQATGSPITYDLAAGSNYHVRFDGAAAGDNLGLKDLQTGDFNGNGKVDVLVGAGGTDHNSLSNSGSFYIIYDIDTRNFSGTANTIDLATAGNYYLRIDGPQTLPFLSSGDFDSTGIIDDYNGDGKDDIIFSFGNADVGATNTGSIYLLSNELITGFSGTGNTIHLANSSAYTIRIDGHATDVFGAWGSIHKLSDTDGDGKKDLYVVAVGTDFVASQSGSVYVISSTILDDYTGTGNTLDLYDTSKFTLRFDGGAASDSIGIGRVEGIDVNGNGRNDLVISSAWNDANGKTNPGGVYIVYDEILRSYSSGTGNTLSFADTSTYNIRIDGAVAGDELSRWATTFGDIDGDNKLDILAGSINADYNSRTNSGSVWVLTGALLDDYSGTGNALDLADSSKYSLRIDGAAAEDFLSYNNLLVTDFDNDGRDDLLIGSHRSDNNSRLDSGSIYLINSDVLRSYAGTGNLLDMSDTSKHRLRWDAAAAGDRAVLSFQNMSDLNADGVGDLRIMSYFADNNSRADSGSIYVIFNFPHAIATPTVGGDEPTANRTITGSIDASHSITTISSVQASVNTNSFGGSWTDCSAADGAFDGKTEGYSCSLTLPSHGSHTIRIRAKDSNGVYTPASKYKAVTAVYTSSQPSPTVEPSPEVTVTPADTTAPTVTLASITGTRVRSTLSHFTYASKTPRPIFAGSAEAGAKIAVRAGDEVLCEGIASSDGQWNCTATLLQFKDYPVQVSATDVAGNETKLPVFTLKVVEQLEISPSPQAVTTPENSASGEGQGVRVEITHDPSVTGSETIYTPSGLVPYVATVRFEDEQLRISHFKLRVLNRSGEPLVEAPVTLNSSPQTSITDTHGVATFGNVPAGRHTLSYIYKGVKVSLPVEIAVAADVLNSLESGNSVQVTLAPVEVHLPIAQFGLITVAWILVLILTVAVSGYFGYRHASVLFPQWQLASHHQLANLQAFDDEINRVQDSTKTTWPIFARLHNWLRMNSRAYYWWHLLPRHKYWITAFLAAYLCVLALIIYRAWLTF